MSTLPTSPFPNTNLSLSNSFSSQNNNHSLFFHTHFLKPFPFPFPQTLTLPFRTPPSSPLLCKSSEAVQPQQNDDDGDNDDEEWLKKLPEKSKPLYSHSLPCIEAWLRSLGFWQSKEDRALWVVHKPDWHAHLSLDVTDLYVRYLKSGPGNLEKDVERRFSYALSREDIENAVLGGP